jgi:hypothetical protein
MECSLLRLAAARKRARSRTRVYENAPGRRIIGFGAIELAAGPLFDRDGTAKTSRATTARRAGAVIIKGWQCHASAQTRSPRNTVEGIVKFQETHMQPRLLITLMALAVATTLTACGKESTTAADAAKKAAAESAEKAKVAASQAADAAKDATKEAASATADAASKAADAAKDATAQAADATKDAAGKAVEAAKEAAAPKK